MQLNPYLSFKGECEAAFKFYEQCLGGQRGREASMRAYVITSGVIFGLLVLAHLLRILEEGPHLARDPSYVLVTLAAAALCVWAFRVLRMSARGNRSG
jgi:hypothetical protein